jgi:Domain of unknown function DUF29
MAATPKPAVENTSQPALPTQLLRPLQSPVYLAAARAQAEKHMALASTRDEDVYAWLLDQAQRLRDNKPAFIDWMGLAEELEDIVALQRAKVVNLLAQLQAHLLKWEYSKFYRSEQSWRTTLNNTRTELSVILDESRTLRNELPKSVEKAYSYALKLAGDQMRLMPRDRERLFPAECPYTLAEILNIDFLPELSPTANGRS